MHERASACKQYIFRSCDASTFKAVRSNFLLLLVGFKLHYGGEEVKAITSENVPLVESVYFAHLLGESHYGRLRLLLLCLFIPYDSSSDGTV